MYISKNLQIISKNLLCFVTEWIYFEVIGRQCNKQISKYHLSSLPASLFSLPLSWVISSKICLNNSQTQQKKICTSFWKTKILRIIIISTKRAKQFCANNFVSSLSLSFCKVLMSGLLTNAEIWNNFSLLFFVYYYIIPKKNLFGLYSRRENSHFVVFFSQYILLL